MVWGVVHPNPFPPPGSTHFLEETTHFFISHLCCKQNPLLSGLHIFICFLALSELGVLFDCSMDDGGRLSFVITSLLIVTSSVSFVIFSLSSVFPLPLQLLSSSQFPTFLFHQTYHLLYFPLLVLESVGLLLFSPSLRYLPGSIASGLAAPLLAGILYNWACQGVPNFRVPPSIPPGGLLSGGSRPLQLIMITSA